MRRHSWKRPPSLPNRRPRDRSRSHSLRGGRRDDTRCAPARRRVSLRQRAAARSLAGSARGARASVAGGLRRRPDLGVARCRRAVRDRPGSARLRPAVKGVLPGIEPSDRLLLWGGGIWNWFDPLTVIRAVGRLAETRSDVKLLFLGLAHPSSAVGEMTMADQAVALATELGLDGRSVFFNRAWVPYDERLAWFAEADLGVSAHRDSLEAQAGLPHEVAGSHRLRDAAGRDARATCWQTSSSRGSWAGSSLRATSTAGRRRWPSCSMTIAPTPRRGSAVTAAQDELSWSTGRRAARGADRTGRVDRLAGARRRLEPSSAPAATLARSSLERRGFRATVTAASRAVSGGRRR